MAPSLQLLDDQQVRDFITRGCVTLHPDFPPQFHAGILGQIEDLFARDGNPGNDILPRVPQLRDVLDHPVVAGALTSQGKGPVQRTVAKRGIWSKLDLGMGEWRGCR